MASSPFALDGARQPSESAEDYALRGLALMRAGEFEAAVEILTAAATELPNSRKVHLALAALMTRTGSAKGGHAVYDRFIRANPLGRLVGGAKDAEEKLLVMRGFDKTRPTLGKRSTGEYKPKLRGGHFTIQYLLRKQAVARQTFTIAGDAGLNADALPDFDVMLNTMAEPDIEGASLKSLGRYLDVNPDTPIINHPDRVWATARDRNFQRLQGIGGFTFPKTVRFTFNKAGAAELGAALATAEMQAPTILRRVGTQTGRTTALVSSGSDLVSYAKKPMSGDYYAIEYREILWQGEYFRKLRLFCIDGEFYPVVCHLDKIWNVHGGNRKDIMRNDEVLMAEEKSFLADWKSYVGPGNADILYKIAEATQLEFFGIDFTVDDDGKIFIYELNPSMRHSFDHAKNFPYKLPYDQATTAAFEAMVMARINRAKSLKQNT